MMATTLSLQCSSLASSVWSCESSDISITGPRSSVDSAMLLGKQYRYHDAIIIITIINIIISMIIISHEYHRSKVLSVPSFQIHCKDSLAHSVSNLHGNTITYIMMLVIMVMMVMVMIEHDHMKIHDNPRCNVDVFDSDRPTPFTK